jgi:hypothetical protein
MSEENSNDVTESAEVQAEEVNAEVESSTTETPQVEGAEESNAEVIPKKRFNKVYYQKNQAERERDEAKKENDALRQQLESKQQPNHVERVAVDKGEPTLEDFDYDDTAYQSALIDHKVEQRFAQQKRNSDERSAKNQRQVALDSFNDKAAAYIAANQDYEELNNLAENVSLSETVQEAIISSDNGPQLHHHLLDNPNEIDRINSLTPIRAAIEIGKLEMKLSIPTSKKVTQAPNPPNIGVTGGNASGDPRYNANLSPEEYYAASMRKAK